MKKKVNKDTKAYKERQVRKVRNRCLKLWKECIKIRANHKCEAPGCNDTERLNAHHIEDYRLNPYLRYEIDNGLCLCPKHHKFGQNSAHRSFLFMTKMNDLFPVRFNSLNRLNREIILDNNLPVQDLVYFEQLEKKLITAKGEIK